MSDYNQVTSYAPKDALPSGSSAKVDITANKSMLVPANILNKPFRISIVFPYLVV